MPHSTPLIAIVVVGLVLAFALGLARAPAARVAAGRLPARRRRGRALHAGLRRRPGARRPARRDRRHPADVRRRPALLAEGPAGGARHRAAGRARRRSRSRPCSAWASPGASAGALGGGLVFGLALSVASTVVLIRALQERRILETDRGRIAVGWLVVEDLAMVLALVLLPAVAGARHRRRRRSRCPRAPRRGPGCSRSARSRPSSRSCSSSGAG